MSYSQTRSGIYVPSSMEVPYKSTDLDNPIFENWRPFSGDPDEALAESREQLRDQARDLDRNDSIAHGAIENIVGNVVGEGLWPQAKLNHKLLGITEQEARNFEVKAETFFRVYAEKTYFDFQRISSFPEQQVQVLTSQLIDGDTFAIRRFKEHSNAIFGTCIQLISASRVTNPWNYNFEKDIVDGIEFNKDGEPIAYHIKNRTNRDLLDIETKRIPRYIDNEQHQNKLQVLHLYNKRYPSQSRGEPLLAPAIEKFKQLSRYSEAELAAAVLNAFFTAFVTTETGKGVLPSREERSVAGLVDYKKPAPKRSKSKFGPMTIFNLLPGEKVDTSTPGRPSPQFDLFVNSVLKQIGPSIGLPYEVLTQHFSSSYSAARAALLQAWKFFKIRRKWLILGFCQPTYEWVIEEAIMRGMLEAPGFFEDPLKRALYLQTEWIGSEMPSIDRSKDAKADKTDLENRTTSRRQIIESRGKDPDKIASELKKEEENHPRKNQKNNI